MDEIITSGENDYEDTNNKSNHDNFLNDVDDDKITKRRMLGSTKDFFNEEQKTEERIFFVKCTRMKCSKESAKKMIICVALSLLGLVCFGTRNWLLSYIASKGPKRTDIVSSVWGWCGTGLLGGIIWVILIPTRFRIQAKPNGTSLKDIGCNNKQAHENISTEMEASTNTISSVIGSKSMENNPPIRDISNIHSSDNSSSFNSTSSSLCATKKSNEPEITSNTFIKYRFGGWDYMLPLFLGGIGSAIGLVTINVAYSVASESKGQITAITASVSAFVALFTFLILREIINVWQTLGISITIAGVVMISVDSNETADLVAFAFGILTAILESICNIAIGYCTKSGMNKLSNGIVLSVMISLDWVIGLPILAIIFGSPIYGLETWMVFASIGAGALTTVGLIGQNIAIGLWSTGTVSAITNSNAIIVMFWDFVIYGKIYSALAISGVFVVLVGTAVLALSPKTRKRWGKTLCACRKKR